LEKFCNAKEIIKQLGISKRTLDNWIGKGIFPKPIKMGRRIFWKESDIEKHIEEMRKLSTTPH